MKKYVILLLFMCFIFPSAIHAQDYFTVIKVSGNIVIERTGSSLGIGTSFSQNENLLFKIPDSRAAVINPDRGRFLITSENLSTFRTSKSNFLPPAGKISTRAINTGRGITDLKNHFEGNYLILDEIRLKIDTMTYPMSDKRFFFITYDYQNRPVNKKLAFSHDTLFIKRNELLAVDGNIIPDSLVHSMKLAYLIVGSESYSASPVCSFTPVFPDNKALGQEVKVIYEMLASKSYNEKMNEINAYVREFYGKFDDASLQKWLFENFGIKK